MKGIVKVGAVDMDADREAGAAYNIQGFPTIKFFGSNKNSPQSYEGGRDEKSIIDYNVYRKNVLFADGRRGNFLWRAIFVPINYN